MAALLMALPASGANWLDFLKRKSGTDRGSAAPAAVSLAGLSQDQMVQGLKEALGKGVQQAVADLGKPDGFLKDLRASVGGGLGAALLGTQATDLDSYVTSKALDGLFLKIAEEERRIRENPVARTSDLLKKVFGAAGK